jgi:hypothetical protein
MEAHLPAHVRAIGKAVAEESTPAGPEALRAALGALEPISIDHGVMEKASGILTVDTIGSTFDTWLGLWGGAAVGSLTLVAQNDDAVGLQSRITQIVTPETQYQISVDGYGFHTGAIALHLAFTAGVPNLAPNQPAGWSNKIVVSKTPGTYVDDSVLYSTDALFVDWSGFNSGTADATAASTADLYLDGTLVQTFAVPPLGPGSATATD